MSLKTGIDKSNKLKEDLKLAKENINARILSGGGTKADTISDVPDKISNMLGNYKKVAIKDIKIDADFNMYFGKKTIDIPVNLNFTPKTVLIQIGDNGSYRPTESDTWISNLTGTCRPNFTGNGSRGVFNIVSVNCYNISIEGERGGYEDGFHYVLTKVIAIE